MKTKCITTLLGLLMALPFFAQDRTTVNAMSPEISDNLDLRAVASIFGEARNLEDFERRINDPNIQISNLDLNYDNQVDYLRVIESVEGYTHLIVIQSVLGRDTFQDVATIQVERDANNQVQVQVVGDVYMYGQNYIYEPVYVAPPVIYTSFWVTNYRPYCSTWYWGYYPTYYVAWNPFPVYRYRNNVSVYINFSNHYNYVNVYRVPRAVALYSTRRANYCEVKYPTRAFAYRNTTYSNRYELDQTRRNYRNDYSNSVASRSTRANAAPVSNSANVRSDYSPVRANSAIRSEGATRSTPNTAVMPRSNSGVRNNTGVRASNPVIANTPARAESGTRYNPAANSSPASNSVIRSNTGGVRGYNNGDNSGPRATLSAPVRGFGNSSQGSVRSNPGDYSQRSQPNRMETSPVRNPGNIAQNRMPSGGGREMRSNPQPNMQRNAGPQTNAAQRANGRR